MKVSVLIITYNHQEFIAQAVESVLEQQTDFDFEIVIGEDCSTDHTRDIVVGLAKRFPGKIRLLLREENIGPNRNFVQTLQSCHGEYIALLEGDDYWTSASKLQKQIDFLDGNKDCVLCFHHVEIVSEAGRSISRYPPYQFKKKVSLEDYLSKPYNSIHLASAVLRTNQIDQFPDWYFDMPVGDWPLFILYLQKGPAGYLDERMAVWRHHKGGYWSMKPREWALLNSINACRIVKTHLGYYKYINKNESFFLQRLAYVYADRKDYRLAAEAASKALALFRLMPLPERIELTKILLIGRFPELYVHYSRLKRRIYSVPVKSPIIK